MEYIFPSTFHALGFQNQETDLIKGGEKEQVLVYNFFEMAGMFRKKIKPNVASLIYREGK